MGEGGGGGNNVLVYLATLLDSRQARVGLKEAWLGDLVLVEVLVDLPGKIDPRHDLGDLREIGVAASTNLVANLLTPSGTCSRRSDVCDGYGRRALPITTEPLY